MQVKIIYQNKESEILQFENWELVNQFLIENKCLCAFSVENSNIKSFQKKEKPKKIKKRKKVEKNEFVFSAF